MAADPSFFIVRRFSNLFSRNLLLKQDRLADLEAQLAQVDLKEDVQWYLSSRRGDQNAERLKILHDLDEALREYGELLFCVCLNQLNLVRKRCLVVSSYGRSPKAVFD